MKPPVDLMEDWNPISSRLCGRSEWRNDLCRDRRAYVRQRDGTPDTEQLKVVPSVLRMLSMRSFHSLQFGAVAGSGFGMMRHVEAAADSTLATRCQQSRDRKRPMLAVATAARELGDQNLDQRKLITTADDIDNSVRTQTILIHFLIPCRFCESFRSTISSHELSGLRSRYLSLLCSASAAPS
jgi:hypothetical protein